MNYFNGSSTAIGNSGISDPSSSSSSSAIINTSNTNNNNNFTSALAAYQNSVMECDALQNVNNMTYNTSAYTFFMVYTIGVPLQLCILPANVRLAKHRSAFLLLLHINFLDLIWLLQYIWLCIEFILGQRVHVHWNLEAYLFRFVNFCIDALYIELALNRTMAVLDGRGRLYERLFNVKSIKLYLACTYVFGLIYAAYVNWLPERRPFHCLEQLVYLEPTAIIPKHLLAHLPDNIWYDWIQQLYMVCIDIPILLYVAAFSKLFFKFAQRRLLVFNSSASVEPELLRHHSIRVSNEEEVHAHIANLMLERSRLFLLCFLSQLPYLISNGLYHLTRIFQIEPKIVRVMTIFWQLFGTIFHVQQPVLMLLLSRDIRRGVCEDFARIIAGVKGALTRRN